MEKFGHYLKDIGLTSAPFTEKIESVYNICSQMCPEEIKDIFVTNYKKNRWQRRIHQPLVFLR